jgi:hypothetical protein
MLRYCTCSAVLCTLVPGSVAFSPNAKLLQLRSTRISPRTAHTLHASADDDLKESHHTPEEASKIARERREKVRIRISYLCNPPFLQAYLTLVLATNLAVYCMQESASERADESFSWTQSFGAVDEVRPLYTYLSC